MYDDINSLSLYTKTENWVLYWEMYLEIYVDICRIEFYKDLFKE